jgi:inosine-uridine nucleoside N-ribohydrolase
MRLNAIGKSKGKSAIVASKILSYPVSRHKIFHLHDVFALARLLKPNMFKAVDCRVNVNKFGKFRGRCVITLKKGNVNVCSYVDPSIFNKFVTDGLSGNLDLGKQ